MQEESVTPVIEYNETDVDYLARLMRAEAIGDGEYGMLLVGNVVVNRALNTSWYSFNACSVLSFKLE